MKEAILNIGISMLVRTLRLKWHGDALPAHAVITFWHSRMIAGWWVVRHKAVALVSQSKDGSYLSRILSSWGYRLVRGSSGKSGMQALEEAIEIIRSNSADRIIITPDGPRGPSEIFKRGAFIAANQLQRPLFFLEIRYRKAITFTKSWDRFRLPLPFSSVSVTPHLLDASSFPASREEQDAWLKELSQQFQTEK